MSHTYKHGDKIFPSVTTIIGESSNKDALIQWAANSCRDYVVEHWEDMQGMCIDTHLNAARFAYRALSHEALDTGSTFHNMAEYTFKTLKIPNRSKDEKANNCFDAFLSWGQDYEIEILDTEKPVYGPDWAGTLDLECMLNGIHTIVDYKTSKAIYLDSMGPQLAAYWSVTNAEEAGILRVDKETGQYEYKRLKKKALNKYLKIFNAMAELYFIKHPIIARKARG